MTDINRKILEAMKNDEGNYAAPEEEATIFNLIGESFRRSAFRYTVIISIVFMFVFVSLSAYCGYQMLTTDDIALKINWLTGTILTFLVFAIMRLWFFLELSRLSVIREVKRVEMQVALLADQLSR